MESTTPPIWYVPSSPLCAGADVTESTTTEGPDLDRAEDELIEIREIAGQVLPFTLGTTILYAVLFALGLTWNLIASFPLLPPRLDGRLVAELAGGVAVGCVTVFVVGVLWTRTRLFSNLEPTLAEKLGALTPSGILRLALLSSVAEEVFFRGALQPFLSSALGGEMVGYVVTSLLFGVLHGSSRTYRAWTVFATLCGFLLGGAYVLTDHILTPIVIHFIINALNMARIVRRRTEFV